MKMKVIGQGNKYLKVEVLPNVVLKIPRSEVKIWNGKVILFKNPLSGLNCIAVFE